MNNNKSIVSCKRGFTLIELLVVVLIIGILAAVDVPQYQKAVLKSRFVQAKILVNSLAKAEEVYYLTNNTYTTKLADLDIDLPSGKDEDASDEYTYHYDWGYCSVAVTENLAQAKCKVADIIMYQQRLFHSQDFPLDRICVAATVDKTDKYNQLCKAETGDPGSCYNAGGYCFYTYKK